MLCIISDNDEEVEDQTKFLIPNLLTLERPFLVKAAQSLKKRKQVVN